MRMQMQTPEEHRQMFINAKALGYLVPCSEVARGGVA